MSTTIERLINDCSCNIINNYHIVNKERMKLDNNK